MPTRPCKRETAFSKFRWLTLISNAPSAWDRVLLASRRGGFSVQELYDNDDHSKLKLTIAQYLTPGDRSIQNLGIVPDIQLQRMYIPDKNDSPSDFVRMLAPTHSYGEKDLDAHLVSTYAKDSDKPEYELPFLVEKKKPWLRDQRANEFDLFLYAIREAADNAALVILKPRFRQRRYRPRRQK